ANQMQIVRQLVVEQDVELKIEGAFILAHQGHHFPEHGDGLLDLADLPEHIGALEAQLRQCDPAAEAARLSKQSLSFQQMLFGYLGVCALNIQPNPDNV